MLQGHPEIFGSYSKEIKKKKAETVSNVPMHV